jgi:hypothetical protein
VSKLIAAIKRFWSSLPHQVQALILLFATAAGTTLGKEFQELFLGNEAFTWLMFKHDIVVAAVAGVTAVRIFYMMPNRSAKQLSAQATQGGMNVPNPPNGPSQN